MPDYIIDFTDPLNGSFVIKPYTTNGPASPGAPTPLDPQAVTASTSIVLLGQGMFQYGERFQESVVHMLENFAYQSRPAYPIQGQIWYKNIDYVDPLNLTDPIERGLYIWSGTAWDSIALTGDITADLDMNGFKIIDLGTPTDPSDDAVSVNFANATYLRLDATNDPITGTLTVGADIVLTGVLSQITLPNPPVVGTDAVNKTYVDSRVLDDLFDVTIAAPVNGDFLQYNAGVWSNVATAIPTTLDALSDVIITAPAISDLLTYDGVNWVNSPAAAGTDRYVVSGGIVDNTLTLTMSTALPSPTIIVSGAIAIVGHTHVTQNIFHDENPTFDSSYIREARITTVAEPNPFYPQNDGFNNVVDAIDQTLYVSRKQHKRRVLQSDGTVGPYDLNFDYLTHQNKLSVYVNGVKQYVSSRGRVNLSFDSPSANAGSNTGLSIADYAIAAVVTGVSLVGNFQIVGNVTATFPTGTVFSVIGSTGNDAVWEVTTSTFVGPNTEIEVTATIFNATADGIISVVSVLNYEFDVAVDVADWPPGTTSTTITVRPPPLEISLPIRGVNIGLDTFTVSGDYTSTFTAGRAFVVTGSNGSPPTGHNGKWQVLSSVLLVGSTVITIDPTPSIVANTDITSSVIEGIIAVGFVSIAGLTEEINTQFAAATIAATAFFRDSAILFSPDSQGNVSTVELLNTTGGGTSLLNTLDATYGASEVIYDGYSSNVDITGVDTANDEFEVAGDYTAAFTAGTLFTVQGTTGFVAGIPIVHGTNDGVFEVVASTFALGTTSIEVTANLVVNTGASGTIFFSRSLAYEENGVPYDDNNQGSAITFTTAPTAGALIEAITAP